VKKVQIVDPEPAFDPEEEEQFMEPMRRTKTRQMEAAGGGGGGPVGAGAGGQFVAPYGHLAVRKLTPYVPPRPLTHLEKLQKELMAAKAVLHEVNERASESFIAACIARNGNDYNKHMDQHAIHQTESIRLHNIVNDLEDAVFIEELTVA
jgi:hypothetical protein